MTLASVVFSHALALLICMAATHSGCNVLQSHEWGSPQNVQSYTIDDLPSIKPGSASLLALLSTWPLNWRPSIGACTLYTWFCIRLVLHCTGTWICGPAQRATASICSSFWAWARSLRPTALSRASRLFRHPSRSRSRLFRRRRRCQSRRWQRCLFRRIRRRHRGDPGSSWSPRPGAPTSPSRRSPGSWATS
jgi:hypothetical protein